MPFQVPEGPYAIDKVMDSIREQIVQPSNRESMAAGANDPEALTRALSHSINLLNNLTSAAPDYQIRSHRPWLRVLIDPIKKLIHWGARPYTDAVRQRQDDWNAMAIDTLREIRNLFARMNDTITKVGARHDLGFFFAAVPEQERLATLDKTRGDYADIHMRQKIYIDYFRNLPGQTLDVGCGRGELLNQLRLEGIECWGADVDPLMVRMTQSKGVHAVQTDAISALRTVESGKLGGVFAAQVIEHMFPGELLTFLKLALEKLAPGGRMVLETLNPASLAVLAKSYCRDIDHKQPIHPEYMKMLVELAGFENVELHYLHPFAAHEVPPDLPSAEALGVNGEGYELLRLRFEQMDRLLYGMQDYYLVAVRPADAHESQTPEIRSA